MPAAFEATIFIVSLQPLFMAALKSVRSFSYSAAKAVFHAVGQVGRSKAFSSPVAMAFTTVACSLGVLSPLGFAEAALALGLALKTDLSPAASLKV